MKFLKIWIIALLICLGIFLTADVAGVNASSDCRILTLSTSSGYATPGGRIVLIPQPTPIGPVSWQVALASGIDSSNLTTAHFHDIALSPQTIIAVGRAMKRQKVGHDIAAWAAEICRIQLSGPVPQWVFDEQRKIVDLYDSLRPV